MNIKQVESDFKNGVLLSRATIGALIAWGITMQEAAANLTACNSKCRFNAAATECEKIDTAEAAEVMHALADMAQERQQHDATKRMNANIDAQMAQAEAARLAKRDRRQNTVAVEFDRRASAEDRRATVRRHEVRRAED